MSQVEAGTPLWEPSQARIENSGVNRFIKWVNQHYSTELSDYQTLWRWSVEDVARFWEAVWQCYEIESSTPYREVLCDAQMPGTQWFAGAKLNMAEYLLKQGEIEFNGIQSDPLRPAVLAESEIFEPRTINWVDLREQVAQLATHLRSAGVQPGDRVVAYLPGSIESIVSVLAVMSVGAIWSSCSPDFGPKSVLERFSQIEPKVLITVTGYSYNGKGFNRLDAVNQIIEALPSLTEVIHLPWLDHAAPKPPNAPANKASADNSAAGKISTWAQALDNDASYASFEFEQVEFNHPLWIMYSSGTTGMPKGIVHSQGGVLIESIKFAWLHDDLKPDSVKFFFTTTGWAMFNMLIGGFASGSAIVLFDGSPTYPQERLWDMSERFGITYFGASPTYINGLMAAGYSPKEHFDLSKITTVASGGSPVSPENFEWFYQNIHEDLHVVSMSGGTDIASAFVGGTPTQPVHAGIIQAPCLGVDVCGFDDEGHKIVGEDGELVITQPMPSMPLFFWNDKDGSRYKSSYFETFPGIWRQGDLVHFNEDNSCSISGRSDATLNRFGIRIGTSEIYRNVECIEGIKDSLIINIELPSAQFFMPMFVVMKDGFELNDNILKQIKKNLSENCSPRHVPEKVYVIDEIPYTLSGKKQEIPVKKLLTGKPLEKAVNLGACANPKAIEYFVEFAKTIEQEYA